jgi:hypothetical protein
MGYSGNALVGEETRSRVSRQHGEVRARYPMGQQIGTALCAFAAMGLIGFN